jgi:hypothetical protein
MRKLHILLTISLVLLLAACKKDKTNSPVDPPQEEPGIKKKFQVKSSSGGGAFWGLWQYAEDKVNHVIYNIDMRASIYMEVYQSFHLDASGRLEKVVHNNSNYRDSIMITRPAANTIRFTYSAEWQPEVNRLNKTVITSSISNGRKLIEATYDGYNPATVYDRYYMNAAGTMDSSIMKFTSSNGNVFIEKEEFFYDANQIPITLVKTSFQSDIQRTYTRTFEITKENQKNEYLNNFLSKTFGTDLAWMSYRYYTTGNAVYNMSIFNQPLGDRVWMMNGSAVLTIVTDRDYTNGVLIRTYTPVTYENRNTYDSKGRITKIGKYINGGGTPDDLIEVEYFD